MLEVETEENFWQNVCIERTRANELNNLQVLICLSVALCVCQRVNVPVNGLRLQEFDF